MTTARDLLAGLRKTGNVLKRVKDLERSITQVPLRGVPLTLPSLDLLTDDLGLVQAGEFRAGNGQVPGGGFTGVRIAYPAMSYSGSNFNIVGIANDELQFGLDSDSGSAIFGGGVGRVNSDGIQIVVPSSFSDKTSYKFIKSDGTVVSRYQGVNDSASNLIRVIAIPDGAKESKASLEGIAATNGQGIAQITAQGGAWNSVRVEVKVDTAGGRALTLDSTSYIISNVTYTWPTSQGNSNNVLTNNGNGGLSWAATSGGNPSTLKMVTSPVTVVNTASKNNLFTYSVPANTLGASGALDIEIWGNCVANANAADNIVFFLEYGGTTLSDPVHVFSKSATRRAANIRATLFANQSNASQKGNAAVRLDADDTTTPNTAIFGGYGTANVAASAAQNLIFAVQLGAANAALDFVMDRYSIVSLPQQ